MVLSRMSIEPPSAVVTGRIDLTEPSPIPAAPASHLTQGHPMIDVPHAIRPIYIVQEDFLVTMIALVSRIRMLGEQDESDLGLPSGIVETLHDDERLALARELMVLTDQAKQILDYEHNPAVQAIVEERIAAKYSSDGSAV
jgi:hypothetical protein